LAVVPALRTALSSASSSLLASIRDVVCAVPALQTLTVRIDQLLDDEVCSGKAAFIAVTQQVFAIRTGVDGFLDVGAQTLRSF
jgi:DNA mismatch repair protein MSH4